MSISSLLLRVFVLATALGCGPTEETGVDFLAPTGPPTSEEFGAEEKQVRLVSTSQVDRKADQVGSQALDVPPTPPAPTANPSRLHAGKSRIYGRVVDVRGGAGLPGATVTLYFADREWIQRKSGQDGEFEFWIPASYKPTKLFVRAPKGWRWTHHPSRWAKPLTPEQKAGKAPFVFEMAEFRTGRVRGIAVDSETGEPIPHLAFRIRPRDPSFSLFSLRFDTAEDIDQLGIKLVTDEAGRFSCDTSISGGSCQILQEGGGLHPSEATVDLLIPDDQDGDALWRVRFR